MGGSCNRQERCGLSYLHFTVHIVKFYIKKIIKKIAMIYTTIVMLMTHRYICSVPTMRMQSPM